MKTIALMKAVPDSGSRLIVNEGRTWIRDANLSFAASEADTFAIEAALRIREQHGGEVVAMSMGNEPALRVLRAALAMGADRAILVSDDLFAGSDEVATARVLASAVNKDSGADLLLAGVQSDDLGSGATGIMVAEFLGLPHASVVIGVDPRPETARIQVRRELDGGVNERVELQMPCVLTLQYGINQPRYPSLKGIMAAKKKVIDRWGAADLGLEASQVGKAGAMYSVVEVFVPDRTGNVEILSGSPGEAAAKLIERLRNEAKVL